MLFKGVLGSSHKPREQVSDQHKFRLQPYGRRQVQFLSVSLGLAASHQ